MGKKNQAFLFPNELQSMRVKKAKTLVGKGDENIWVMDFFATEIGFSVKCEGSWGDGKGAPALGEVQLKQVQKAIQDKDGQGAEREPDPDHSSRSGRDE